MQLYRVPTHLERGESTVFGQSRIKHGAERCTVLVQLRMLQTFVQLRYCRVLVQVGFQAQTRCIETGCRAQQQCRPSQHRHYSYISNSEMEVLLRCQKHAIVSGNNADYMSTGQTEDCMAYIVQLIKSTSDSCAVYRTYPRPQAWRPSLVQHHLALQCGSGSCKHEPTWPG